MTSAFASSIFGNKNVLPLPVVVYLALKISFGVYNTSFQVATLPSLTHGTTHSQSTLNTKPTDSVPHGTPWGEPGMDARLCRDLHSEKWGRGTATIRVFRLLKCRSNEHLRLTLGHELIMATANDVPGGSIAIRSSGRIASGTASKPRE